MKKQGAMCIQYFFDAKKNPHMLCMESPGAANINRQHPDCWSFALGHVRASEIKKDLESDDTNR